LDAVEQVLAGPIKDPAVALAEVLQTLPPPLHPRAGRYRECNGVEPRQRASACRVQAQRHLHRPSRIDQRDAHQRAVLDELHPDLEPEHLQIPVAAARDIGPASRVWSGNRRAWWSTSAARSSGRARSGMR